MRKLKIVILIFLLMFSLISSVYASSDEEKLNIDNIVEEQGLNQSSNIGGLLLRFLVSVLGVIILTYLGVKFFANRSNALINSSEWMQILDQMPLGPNKGIYLVEIEGKGYVLGVTDQQINLITTIEEEKRMDELRGLSIAKHNPSKFKFNFFKPKKNTDFHQSLQHYIKHTENLYLSNKKGDRNYED
ncbi:MAG: flagellar protein FliO/FliZ [Clostridia bacterium]|jgi:flagellar protein FliO/FliZ|nr:flagellar protein FliO/FliZ [Clostridia bacterium]MDN5322944.1 flagellar protein FliO/FliZ [Clostridia bacterium]